MPRDTRDGARRVVLGLGSNHHPEKTIPEALDRLGFEFDLLVKSSRYVGPPEVNPGKPADGPIHGQANGQANGPASDSVDPDPSAGPPDYSNVAVLIRTADTYGEIKATLTALEEELGRDRSRPGIVAIDIDILLIEGEIIRSSSKKVLVPHPDLATKRHAAIPSSEVAPSLRDPVSGARLAEIASRLA